MYGDLPQPCSSGLFEARLINSWNDDSVSSRKQQANKSFISKKKKSQWMSKPLFLYSDVPYRSRKGRRESIIRLADIHNRLLGYKGDDNYNYIINVLSGAIPAANTIDKVKRLIDLDRADDSINGTNKILDFLGEQISASHFALILNGNKYTTYYAHYLSLRLLTSLSPEKICDRIGCPSDVEAFKRMETF